MAKNSTVEIQTGRRGVVVAHHPLTARAGLAILQSGGNAVDAAVCAAFVNSVVRPGMNGLGGFGGCMAIHLAGAHQVVAVDYSTVAPAEAHAHMFAPIQDHEITPGARIGYPLPYLPGYATKQDANVTGYQAISVPPQLAGLALALERYGTLSLAEVLAPAIRIAEDGFILDALSVNAIESEITYCDDFPATREFLAPGGRIPHVGDRMVRKELAETMRRIAEDGARSFYAGPIADRMIGYLRAHGAILARDDLSTYQARVEERPSSTDYRGYEIYTPSLYCGGGATILQILNLLERFDLHQRGRASPDLLHLIIEAMKLAWRDRLEFMGDPDTMSVPEAHFISKAYASQQCGRLSEALRSAGSGAASSVGAAGAAAGGLGHTTHMNVWDAKGNVVSLTQTDGWSFGSLVTIPGLGFNMNNGMSSFDPRPGRVNSIAPRKRPIGRMCPIIVLKDGQPIIAVGAAGGRRIMTVLVQILIDLIDFGVSAQEAIHAPRLHCEAEEPVLVEYGENVSWGFPKEVVDSLEKMGHELRYLAETSNPLYRRTALPFLITRDPLTGELRGVARKVALPAGAAAGY